MGQNLTTGKANACNTHIHLSVFESPWLYTQCEIQLKGQKEGIIYSIEPRVSLQVLSHSFKKTQNKIWNEKHEFQAVIKTAHEAYTSTLVHTEHTLVHTETCLSIMKQAHNPEQWL